MNIRQTMEFVERSSLSPFATLSENTRGREKKEEECEIRTAFQRDRDRILHCKAFRRMKHKTQVFLTPDGDHYRTRLTHTLEVSQIARTIAKALRLNEELTEAVALGHDLGHTPFGHAGEDILNELCEGGFRHNKQSVRIVEKLEKNGRGLNLTWEVRDGILKHQTCSMPVTSEGKVVRLSDKVAYINHDIDDAIRAGVLTEDEIPREYRQILGNTTRERLNTLICDMILHSQGQSEIQMSPDVESAMKGLRQFMFQHVYKGDRCRTEEEKAKDVLRRLFCYYTEDFHKLPNHFFTRIQEGIPGDRVVCDYIAGMTDQYALAMYQDLFMPKSWKIY